MALPELNTRSVLDVVTENFEKVGLKAFACRIVYAGDHTLEKAELIRVVKSTVDAANNSYCDVYLMGLLLVYDAYFVHVLEGSEDTVNRQLRFLIQKAREYDSTPPLPPTPPPETTDSEQLTQEEQTVEAEVAVGREVPERKMFKRMKFLMAYHSIEDRTIVGWHSITGKPPTLITKLNMYGSMAEHMEQLRICLRKIDKLVTMYNEDPELSFDGVSAADPKMEGLPEYMLLELLLDSPHVIELREYMGYHRRVDDHTFYFELVWPLPTHYTPRNLYKLKIDDSFVEPLPLQEWQKVEQTEGEDEREKSSGSESD